MEMVAGLEAHAVLTHNKHIRAVLPSTHLLASLIRSRGYVFQNSASKHGLYLPRGRFSLLPAPVFVLCWHPRNSGQSDM